MVFNSQISVLNTWGHPIAQMASGANTAGGRVSCVSQGDAEPAVSWVGHKAIRQLAANLA